MQTNAKFTHDPRFFAVDWESWQPQQRATLLFVIRNGQVLLIDKKRGLGAGKVNGPGGRLDPGETPEEAAIREVQEELAVTPTGVRPSGQLAFQFVDDFSIHVYVFKADGLIGEPKETDEAVPRWTPIDAIPYDRMWEDDRFWFPMLLKDEPFFGRFLFDGDTMLGYELKSHPRFKLML